MNHKMERQDMDNDNDGDIHIAGEFPYFLCRKIFDVNNPENWVFRESGATCAGCIEVYIEKQKSVKT